jgi:NitT/TauT family transport system substrate-binding protein
MKTAKIPVALSMVSVAAILLAGCSSGSPSGASVDELTPFTVVVGSPVPGLYTSDVYVADEMGFFEDEGLDVSVQYSQNTSTATQTVAAGQGDVGGISYEGLIMSYAQGLPGKFIYQSFVKNLYFVAVPDGSDIKAASQLAGKKIGVPGLASGAVGFLGIMLEDAGLRADSVTLVPVDPGSATTALQKGQVDALAYFTGGFAPLPGLTLRQLPVPGVAQVGNVGYFASDSAISKRGDVLTKFLRAIAKATVFMQANPEATADIYFKVNPDKAAMGKDAAVAALTHTYLPFFETDQPFGAFDPALKAYIQAFGKATKTDKLPSVDQLSDSQFISSANDFDVEKIKTASAK